MRGTHADRGAGPLADAVAAVGRWGADGVGFVFGPGRAFTGLDLDHVIEGGVLDPAYRWVVDEAATYAEVSPSGDGLHLIFRGAKPAGATHSRRSQPGGRVVEMYDHDRYFTVTGDVFEGHARLAENPSVVERAYRTWIEPEAQPRLAAAVRRPAGDVGDGELSRSVTSTAPWVAADLVDVDTGDVRALVRVAVAGGVRERALDRDVLLAQNKIISALAPMGANVSSTNTKDVVRYLTDVERRCGWARPRSHSVTHLGWAEGPLTAFMPYDLDGTVRFNPSPDEAVKARPFMEPAGSLEAWVEGMAPARASSMAFRCVMAASFASPLVSLLGGDGPAGALGRDRAELRPPGLLLVGDLVRARPSALRRELRPAEDAAPDVARGADPGDVTRVHAAAPLTGGGRRVRRRLRQGGRRRMSWWTEEQDDVLREVSFRGAEFAATEIERRCGVRHSVRAVEMRASRIHCSLAVQTVCPQCGAVGVKINRQTGMCPLCTERYHLEQERAFNEQLERERAACERSDELADVRRERDRMRRRNSRLCRKYGLKGKRERKK